MKNLICILTCITLCASLSSCSNDDDDDDKKDPVAGMWSQKIGDNTHWFHLYSNTHCSYTVTEGEEDPYNKLWTVYRYNLQDNNRIKISGVSGVGVPPEYETWLEGTYTDTEIVLSNDTETFRLKKLE
ncbi:MAG: hypothetical protein ACK5M3_15485 [Dysgonomonas sp.]